MVQIQTMNRFCQGGLNLLFFVKGLLQDAEVIRNYARNGGCNYRAIGEKCEIPLSCVDSLTQGPTKGGRL